MFNHDLPQGGDTFPHSPVPVQGRKSEMIERCLNGSDEQ